MEKADFFLRQRSLMDALISIIPKISEILFQPEIFKIFLGSLIGLALLVVFIYLRQSGAQSKQEEEEKNKFTQYWQRQLKEYENKNSELLKSLDGLKTQLENQAKQIESLNKTKKEELSNQEEVLRKKEEILRGEISSKEKLLAELTLAQDQLSNFKSQLDAKEKELSLVSKLRDDLSVSEEAFRQEAAAREKLQDEFQNAESTTQKLHAQLKSTQEMYNGLKEQYDDLERHVDALNQSLALEKTLHQRLKEEQSRPAEPASS